MITLEQLKAELAPINSRLAEIRHLVASIKLMQITPGDAQVLAHDVLQMAIKQAEFETRLATVERLIAEIQK